MNSSVWAIWAAQAVRKNKRGLDLFQAAFEGAFLKFLGQKTFFKYEARDPRRDD